MDHTNGYGFTTSFVAGDRFRPSFLDTSYPKNKTAIDYLFVNHSKLDVLMKTKVMDFEPVTTDDLPPLEKAIVSLHEDRVKQMILKPVRLFPDPFRGGQHKIALCELYEDEHPSRLNTRHILRSFMERENVDSEEPWMGFEQEFFLLDQNGEIIGSNIDLASFNSKVNYGPSAALERQIAEQHMKACMLAGLSIYGMVKETHFGQWEYQLGPTDCVKVADELIVSRYLLNRIAEMFGVKISFAAVHFKDEAKTSMITSGLHLNYSTKETRAENGIEVIHKFVRQLSEVNNEAIFPFFDRNSGKDTTQRLSGTRQFTYDDLNAKRFYFRIPLAVQLNKRGYLEDRRPCADCDPYEAILAFLKSIYTQELIRISPNGTVEK